MTNKRTIFPKAPSTKFVVRNIAPNNKTVRVFNTPIRNRDTYDILSVPEISEADIRHSLLKGELRIKFLCQELFVVESDIDLLQFNDENKTWLESIGITKGLEVTGTGTSVLNFAFKQDIMLIGTKDGSNRIFTTPENFIQGALGNNEFAIQVNLNSRILIDDLHYIATESGGAGAGFDTVTFISNIKPKIKDELLVNYVVEIP